MKGHKSSYYQEEYKRSNAVEERQGAKIADLLELNKAHQTVRIMLCSGYVINIALNRSGMSCRSRPAIKTYMIATEEKRITVDDNHWKDIQTSLQE